MVLKGFIMSGVTDNFVKDVIDQLEGLSKAGILEEETKLILQQVLQGQEIRTDLAVASSVFNGLRQTLDSKIQDLTVSRFSCVCLCLFNSSKLKIINSTLDILNSQQSQHKESVRSKQAQKQTAKEDNTEEGFRKKLNALLVEGRRITGYVTAMVFPASDCLMNDTLPPNPVLLSQLTNALDKRAAAAIPAATS